MEKYNRESVVHAINESEKEYCKITQYLTEKTADITPVVDQTEYVLPSDCNSVQSVYWNDNRLNKVSFSNNIKRFNESGTPFLYYIRNNNIGLLPSPADVEEKTLTITYQGIGGNMVNDEDMPEIPIEGVSYLIHNACYLLCLEGDDDRWKKFMELAGKDISLAMRNDTYKYVSDKVLIPGKRQQYPHDFHIRHDMEEVEWL